MSEVKNELACVLPSHWAMLHLNDLATINPRLDKSELDDRTELSFVPMSAVEAETGGIDVSEIRLFSEVKKGYTGFRTGDVLFAKITPCMENGKMAIVPELKNEIGFGSTEFHVIRPGERVLSKYIYYFVSSGKFRANAEHHMTGAVGQKRVPVRYLESCIIPVPPLNEQECIVEKIEELFSELDKGIESLKTAREQLKVYRQALLKHAFEGRLTEKWREENADKLETPEQLRARIQQERQARYQQQLEDWEQAVKTWESYGKEGKKPGRPKKLTEFGVVSEIESASFSVLPEGWDYVKLGSLIDDPAYGTSAKCNYDSGGMGVLRIPNIVNGMIDDRDLKYASFGEGEVDNLRLEEGDLLTIRSNGSISLVGGCALGTV